MPEPSGREFAPADRPLTAVGLAGAVWGWMGMQAVIVAAVVRLAAISAEALAMPLTMLQVAFLVGFALFMLYSEGYRGFQVQFAPRFAARALHLARHPTPLRVALAPLYCAGFFGATPRLRRFILTLTVVIVGSVQLVHLMPQPWRGLLDAGVVLGLSWGFIAMTAAAVRVFAGRTAPDPMLPEAEAVRFGPVLPARSDGWARPAAPESAPSESI